jgi:putative polyketide hydroxylase
MQICIRRGHRVDIACVPPPPAAVHTVLLARMMRRWEALGLRHRLRDPKRKSIEEDYYTDQSGSSSGWFVLRPACLRGVEVKLRPQIPGTNLKVLGFNICAQFARDSTLQAGRVFLAGDSARVINPPRPAVGSAATIPRSPGRPQPGLEAVAAVLHGQAGPALLDIPITMNGT